MSGMFRMLPAVGLRLACILAHPDDEAMAVGGILAQYAAQGIGTYVITATRGQRGWPLDPAGYPGPAALGRMRERELRVAAQALGVREVTLLDYNDGELDQVAPSEIIGDLVFHLRRIRPQVVVTFDQYGYYGHPDHIAIAQYATAAVAAAAGIDYQSPVALPPYQVAKLYYYAVSQATAAAHEAALGALTMSVDGVQRRATSWPEWAITTRIDATPYAEQVWNAVACHRTQLPAYEALAALPVKRHQELWGRQSFYRVFSLVNGGRIPETDLFAGLRTRVADDALFASRARALSTVP